MWTMTINFRVVEKVGDNVDKAAGSNIKGLQTSGPAYFYFRYSLCLQTCFPVLACSMILSNNNHVTNIKFSILNIAINQKRDPEGKCRDGCGMV